MAKEIKVKIVVDDDGSLKIVADEANKATKATDKLDKSGKRVNKTRGKFHKLEKGTAGLTNNSTKAFSKQAQTIGSGSSGLVGAYATLAANVFALTAAFGALSRAAAVKKLEEGLMFTGRAAGANLKIVSDQMAEMTGNAISAADAMRSVAVGISAGFSEDQMKGLTTVAEGASKALGRDLTDALDRLTRGAAKLEPEILDELGIMVRLDDVTEKFAASVGKTTGEVTAFEKRMAFTNAIIEQGTQKFGQLNDAVDPDPFNQLKATFDDLVKSIFNGVNTVALPALQLLADNVGILLGVMVMFGAGLAKSMLPGLGNMAAKSAAAAKATTLLSKAQLKGFRVNKNMSMENRKNAKAMDMGNKSRTIMLKSLHTANATIDANTKQMKANLAAKKVDVVQFAHNTTMIKGATVARRDLTKAINSQNIALLKTYESKALALISQGQLTKGLELYRRGLVRAFTRTKALNAGLGSLRMGFAMAATGARVLGAALLNMIPIIGQIIFAVSLALPMLKKLFNKATGKKETSEAVKTLNERLAELPNILQQFEEAMDRGKTTNDAFNTSLSVSVGLVDQLMTATGDMVKEQKRLNMEKAKELKIQAAALREKASGRRSLGERFASMFGFGEQSTKEDLIAEAEFLERLAKGLEKRDPKKLGDEVQSSTIEAYKEFAESFRAVAGQKDQTPFGRGINTEMANVSDLIANFMGQDASKFVAGEGQTKEDVKNKTIAELIKRLETLRNVQKSVQDATKSAKDATQNYNTELDKLKNQPIIKTKYDKLLKNMQAVVKIVEDTVAGDVLKGAVKEDAKKNIIKSLGMDTVKTIEQFEKFKKRADDLQTSLKKLNAENAKQASLQAEQKRIGGVKEGSVHFTSRDHQIGLEIIESKIRANALSTKAIELSLTEKENAEELLRLEKERADLQADLLIKRLEGMSKVIAKSEQQAGMAGFGFGSAIEMAQSGAILSKEQFTGTKEENEAQFDAMSAAEKVSMLGGVLTPMINDMKSLGPEGATIGTAIAGMVHFADVVVLAMDEVNEVITRLEENSGQCFAGMSAAWEEMDFNDKLKVTGGILMGISAALTMMSATMKMASDQKIKEIDREIAQEKKRDGASAASRKRIEQLEAKKEKQKRKAFEQDKKMKIAQAIINTALAATAMYPIPVIGPALAAMVIAMGMKQVSIIKSMQYDGGGDSPGAGASTPTLAVGERSASVDLAQSGSAVGELGYARGEEGVGSAQNFQPAFSGARYRAAGGSVGYVVGEQGPELFMPDTPGTIVPADDTAAATAPASNVNINISAIDAAGVEDVLLSQRGNIIAMIRESANQVGDSFLEKVDTVSEGASY